ncbi:MAG TPA: SDR family NAD(P)-dependent oxidoreductase [Roseiflexaceae bacterium]|nr:SDR family NAD(P)-dependent oxidoreductase [Roseiflexaceae bacterium]
MSAPARTVLITGATDGIGLALARLYAARGDRLVLVGRRAPEQLDDPLFTPARYCRADLARRDCAAPVEAFLRSQGIDRLDLLIHNAALGSYGPLEQQPPAQIDALIDVNLRAPIELTYALLPLLWRASGTLALVSSVAAGLPTPPYAVYSATKAALDGLARSLRVELHGAVAVRVIHPGPTRTAMHAKIGAPLDQIGWRRFPPPELVAANIVRALDRGAPEATIGAGNRALRLADRLAGGLVDRAMRVRPAPAAPLPEHRGGTPHCVITGAADGIGRALALRFAAAGWSVTGIDRDAARAEQTRAALLAHGVAAHFLLTDLTQPPAVEELLASLAGLPPADALIHCAGISAVGRFAGVPPAQQQAVIDVNLRAPLLLTAGALRERLLTRDSTLVFVASLSCFTSYPGAAVYAASKDGLAAFARSLGVALAPHGPRVLTVYPGPTRTAHARRYSPDNRREHRRMPPEQLAEQIFQALQARRRTLIPGAGNRLFALAGRLLPGLTEWAMRRAILDRL